jgi:hypothetical protein
MARGQQMNKKEVKSVSAWTDCRNQQSHCCFLRQLKLLHGVIKDPCIPVLEDYIVMLVEDVLQITKTGVLGQRVESIILG